MHQNKISVLSVDYANGIFICEDGSEYPLLEGLDRMEPDKLNNLYGQATDIERDDATA